ncbi:hypothetical protein HDU96_005853 [Phlyctochytrium bullatum]|nr:hypothetical protein HDU96_005853 [Phlyctochytrium bullatum]
MLLVSFSMVSLATARICAVKRMKKKSQQIEVISFDDKARKDYLLGFHKRNVQKRKKEEQNKVQRAKALKREARRRKSNSKKEMVKDQVELIEAVNKIARGISDSAIEKSTNPDDVFSKVESQAEHEFGGKLVTVTVSAPGDDDDDDPIQSARVPSTATSAKRNMSQGSATQAKKKLVSLKNAGGVLKGKKTKKK